MRRIVAGLKSFTDGVRVLAVDAPGVTEARAPAAGGVLDHADVIACALSSIEVGIGPHGAKAVEVAAAGPAPVSRSTRAPLVGSPATSCTRSLSSPASSYPLMIWMRWRRAPEPPETPASRRAQTTNFGAEVELRSSGVGRSAPSARRRRTRSRPATPAHTDRWDGHSRRKNAARCAAC